LTDIKRYDIKILEENYGNRKNENHCYVFTKILIILFVILINILLPKYNNGNSPYLPAISIIGGADGPTSIYILGNYSWQSILKYFLSAIIIIDTLVLIVFDIIRFKKRRMYTIKYKMKIIISMNIFIIILSSIYIGFQILGFLWIGISILMNIVFCIIFYIKFILIKIIKEENKKIVE
jgi:Na+-transporting methylmalonyl-CoA/oxaloacetate decarboxylase beta subunit